MPAPARRPPAWITIPVLAGALTMWVGATPARASACSDANGVTVVVDFGNLGGGTVVGCAGGGASSGIEALTGAGFDVAFVANTPGFVCRIDAKPADDPCVDTPPASAYWSYWHADPGAEWRVATSGAAGYAPPPGSVEGWSFAVGSATGVPPSIAPPRSAPTVTSTTATTTTAPTTTTTTAAPTTTSKPAAQLPEPTTPATTTVDTTTTTVPAREAAVASTTTAAPSARSPASDGNAVTAAAGLLAAVGLGGAAVAVARKRR